MVHSVARLFMTAALARVIFSSTSVVGGKDLTGLLGRLQNAVRPRHCGHLREAGQTSSGVYTIYHKVASQSGQRVYCDMETDGGDWTVIQRRGQYGNSIFYFNRNWTEYASGFGSPEKEYWIGNRALHALTSAGDQMALRVVLGKSSGEEVSIDYTRFQIASEDGHFRISVGNFKGIAGWDGLTEANGHNFATFDRHNSTTNCTSFNHGAWWFKGCGVSNLNGVNFNGEHVFNNGGIQWSHNGFIREIYWYKYSYPKVRMMIRPAGGRLGL